MKSNSKLAFRAIGKLGLSTRSEQHVSDRSVIPDANSIPIDLVGFARTGTTTAQSILASSFGYNSAFEPFGFNHAALDTFSAAHDHFVGNPRQAERERWIDRGGIPSALRAIDDSNLRGQLTEIFHDHLDAIYGHFGTNVVCKEIRIVANIPELRDFHRLKGRDAVCLGVEAHPYQPLYTYYRLAGLSRTKNPSNLRVDDLYRYRISTYEALDLFEEIRAFSAVSAADCLLISVLLDQAFLRRQEELGAVDWLFRLHDLPGLLGEIGERLGRPPVHDESVTLKESNRFLGDRFFRQKVLDIVQPEIRRYIDTHYVVRVSAGASKPGWRGAVSALRHDLFCSDGEVSGSGVTGRPGVHRDT